MGDNIENSLKLLYATEMDEALCILGHEGICWAKLRKIKAEKSGHVGRNRHKQENKRKKENENSEEEDGRMNHLPLPSKTPVAKISAFRERKIGPR